MRRVTTEIFFADAEHFGTYKTLERLKHNYDWHKMEEDIKDYVRTCDTCQRDKPSRHP